MLLIISTVILRDKLSVVRDKCLAEHYIIASSLIGDIQALEQRGNYVEENIDSLMRLYSRYLQGKGTGLAVAFSGEWIYESSVFALEENMISPPDTVRKGLFIWKTGIRLFFAFMEVFWLRGKITDLCILGTWAILFRHGVIRKIFFF